MVETLVFLVIVLVLFYIFSTRNFNYWKKRNVYFIKPIPFFGSLLPVFRMKKVVGQWMADLCNEAGKDYFGLYLFGQPALMIQAPQLIKAVIQEDASHFPDRYSAKFDTDPTLSNMMYFCKNPHWKSLRTSVSPMFSSGKLKQMFMMMLDESEKMCKYLTKIAEVPNVETKEVCAKYAINALAKSIFAVEANCFENENAEFRLIASRMFDNRVVTATRIFLTWLTPKFTDFLRIGFFEPYVLNGLNSILKEVLTTKRASGITNGTDMVDILLNSNKVGQSNLTDFINGQGIQMMAAGFETISSTISFTLYELCIHPNIQDQLREEIMESMAKYDEKLTYEGICEMKYLDMCLSESFRKYPVLPFLSRVCSKNYKLPGSDLVIEKGVPVFIPIFALNNNPEYFPDPEKFIPERFDEKSNINCNGLIYIPFGEGPRFCIGARYGRLAVKTCLAAILSRYNVVPNEQTPIPLKFETKSLMLQGEVGVPVKLVPLQKGS